MPFTVEDFEDLVQVLEQRPEWRAQLRRLLLPDDVLGLPQLVRQLAEAQLRSEERLGRLEQVVTDLAQAQLRTEERLGRLEQAVADLSQAQLRTEERLGRLEQVVADLAQAQLRTEERLGRLEQVVADLGQQVKDLVVQVAALVLSVKLLSIDNGMLKGGFEELKYSRHASGYFGSILRRIHVLSDEELWDLLEQELDQRRLSYAEARDVALSDIVMRGRSLQDGDETYLVVEVSWKIDNEDVERAIRRAERLGRSGRRVAPVVAGTEVADKLSAASVWRVTDGVAVGPESE